jgi:hypothetical protein
MATTQRVLMISGDCHAGPPQPAFRPYFDSHRAEAEDYCRSRPNRAAAEAAAEGDLEAVAAQLSAFMLQTGAAPETAASFSERALTMTAGLFDSKVRNECLDADGIAGEVIFPDGFIDNHPPFSDAMETEQKFRRLGTRNWPFELRLGSSCRRRTISMPWWRSWCGRASPGCGAASWCRRSATSCPAITTSTTSGCGARPPISPCP